MQAQNTHQDEQSNQRGAKRRRVAQACVPCRHRKSRCNGARPQCSACTELSSTCSYFSKDDSRQISVGKDYLKSLEQRLASLEASVSISRQRSNSISHDNAATDDHERRMTDDIDFADESAESVDGEPHSTSASRDPTNGMGHYIFADEENMDYFGPSSIIYFTQDMSKALLRFARSSEASGTESQRITNLQSGVLAISRPAAPSPSVSSINRSASGALVASATPNVHDTSPYFLPPEKETRSLLTSYFSNTGVLFPYLHRESFLQTYTDVLQKRRLVKRMWLALLNMVLAMATATQIDDHTDAEQRKIRAHTFYSRSANLCGRLSSSHASLETVQYLLLASQYLQGTSTSGQTWAKHGFAVKAALQLGLHSTEAMKRYEPIEQEIRKRTWFGCLVLDRTLSMTFGRPSSIPEEFLKLPLAVSYDEVLQQSPDPSLEHSTNFYNATVTLYIILGQVMKTLYGHNLGVEEHGSSYDHFANILRLEESLEEWSSKLLESLRYRYENSPTEDLCYRLGLILRLRYLNVNLLVHRSVLSVMLRKLGSMDFNSTNVPSLDHGRKASLEACVKSSTEMISIFNAIIRSPGVGRRLLGAWWFSLYYVVDAALVLSTVRMICFVHPQMVVPQMGSPEAWKDTILQAVYALRYLDRGNETVDRCADCLTRLERAITQLSSGSETTSNDASNWGAWMTATPPDSALWAGMGATTTHMQPSALDFGSLFTDNFSFLADLGNS